MSGDLTDVSSWERAWKRSFRRRVPWLKSPLGGSHDDLLKHLIDRARESKPGRLRILEIGCAPGKKLRDLARVDSAHDYSGVDFAPRALDETRRFLRETGVEAELHLADVREFVPDELYDLVVSFGLLEHFDDPTAMLVHHIRLARPGGVVGFELPNYAHPVLERALAFYSPDTLATHNLSIMTLDSVTKLARDGGLVGVESGSYGGAIAPVSRIVPGALGKAARLAATAWNVAFRVAPNSWSPWQGFLWACGQRAS